LNNLHTFFLIFVVLSQVTTSDLRSIGTSPESLPAPTTCREALAQAEQLQRTLPEFPFEPRYAEIHQAIQRHLHTALRLDSLCFSAYLRLGDLYLPHATNSEESYNRSFHLYQHALELRPANPAVHLRLGYLYGLVDELSRACAQYQQGVGDSTLAFEATVASANLGFVDSLLEQWQRAPDESYLLIEQRFALYANSPPEMVCKIWGTGQVDYQNRIHVQEQPVWHTLRMDVPQQSMIDIPRALVAQWIQQLESTRFLTVFPAFPVHTPPEGTLVFMGGTPPNYTLTFHTPQLSHTICLFGEEVTRFVEGKFLRNEYYTLHPVYTKNSPSPSYVREYKITPLGNLCKEILKYVQNGTEKEN